MPAHTHLIISFANNPSEEAATALKGLHLPHLSRLLRDWSASKPDIADEETLSPPHERALAQAWGWTGAPGTWPFAAHAAHQDHIEVTDRAWGLMTPAHWHLARDHAILLDPDELKLDDLESRAFFELVRELFESEGFVVAFGGAMRWYLAHESLHQFPCASMDRAIGRPVDLWQLSSPPARLIRRLQNEVQMLLYRSPLNESREARGELAVNSFWLSGCGRYQPCMSTSVQYIDALRKPALQQNWPAWCAAWQDLDASLLREFSLQADATLTLCGERGSRSFQPQGSTFWQRYASWLRRPLSPYHILEGL